MRTNSTRRDFLRAAAGFAGAAVLAACGGETATAVPATAPRATAAAGGTVAPASGTTAGSTAAAGTTGGTQAAAPAMTRKASGTVRYLLRGGSPDEIKVTQEYLDKNFTPQSGVKVTVEPTDAMADEKLTAAMIGGTAQDVFDTWRDNVVQFSDRGQVLDLEPLVARDFKEADIKDFYPWQWKDFVLPSNVRFGMPKYVNMAVMFYNVDAFEKAGVAKIDESWTHDTLADASKKLTASIGSPAYYWRTTGPDRWWYKVAAWGGSIVDPADSTKATFDQQPALDALEWSRKLMYDDKALAVQANIVGVGQRVFDAIPASFAAGKIAIVEEGFYPFVHAKAVAKKFRWAYAPVPKGPKQRTVLGTADGYAIWKGSKNPDGAWELVKYLSSREYMLNLTQTTGYLPSRFSAIEDWKKICVAKYPELADANLDMAVQAMQQGYPTNKPLFKKDAEAASLITPALEKIFVAGGTPVSYMKEIAPQVTAKMKG